MSALGGGHLLDPAAPTLLRRAGEDEQIKYCIRAAILSRRGERPFSPDIGSELHDFLFRPLVASTISDLKQKVREAVEGSEPRVAVQEVEVDVDTIDRSLLHLKLRYEVRSSGRSGQLRLVIAP